MFRSLFGRKKFLLKDWQCECISMCMNICVYMGVCMCALCTCMYMNACICTCMCMCVLRILYYLFRFSRYVIVNNLLVEKPKEKTKTVKIKYIFICTNY